MTLPKLTDYHLGSIQTLLVLSQIAIYFILFLPYTNSELFNFSSFNSNEQNIYQEGDAFSSNGVLQLTKNQQDGSLTNSVGRSTYSKPVQLWDSKTKRLASFRTHFSFVIKAVNSSMYGEGLSFFLAPFNAEIPYNSTGGFLGLFSQHSAFNSTQNPIVAVEFDSLKNYWDPSDDHVGINVNSIVSVANVTWSSSIKNGSTANAWVDYNSVSKNLSVFLTYAGNPSYNGTSTLFHVVDLRDILPEMVRVGFSASTGSWIEIHNILSWDFFSDEFPEDKSKTIIGLVLGLVFGGIILVSVFGVLFFSWWKKRVAHKKENNDSDDFMDDEFEKGTGPKRFSYNELVGATNNFSEEGKLGEGGFGGVYKGFVGDLNLDVAVKRVSRGSKQGRKEYISEVKIISRVRHRNLVQLLGWCHERGELILVYEYMPNGSLDAHLFGKKYMLTWVVRHKIALGLASALLYLHEEWEQCVVHRDIKSSNVMLDSSFNAKLGDFGLARLVDHESGLQTTMLAGTMGYLAPECVTTGRSSKESDVYSFELLLLKFPVGEDLLNQVKRV
ncbi:hypothetical protein GIB67_005612 [Kingdonia uniflora]|uniref:non-specific serine/threonine protein kinase n=1 Tax=Kingdonia uniflora TaxID=39325 RepID=A0A7J7NHT2_9MAGN|nr:hypothetical protein GIB67_005612 [Kingdonia uniflora]